MGFILFLFGISFTINIILLILIYKLKDKLITREAVVNEKEFEDFEKDNKGSFNPFFNDIK